ncbi:MAG: glycoside hydrolase family 95 protein, partial [Clostridia bacterium]|nr:glycoside hydrolase family 95 protein [Clostridia bacterium]
VRGGAGTGWSLAWKINLNARLNNGQRAYQMIKRQLRPIKSSTVNMHKGGSYYSLLCAHPPFQIDGNFGAASGICEMLLASHEKGLIKLLPAIPKEWKCGSFSGLKARGGITVDCRWEKGKVTYCRMTADGDREFNVKLNGEIKPVRITTKQPFIFSDNM